MKEQIDDGGSAFPGISDSRCGYDEHREPYTAFESIPGMSLRDWFAGQALAHPYTQVEDACNHAAKTAHWAYELADAMLAARKEAQ
jgi:hypothetical protein